MIKCEVIENFTLKDFDKLENIKRKAKDKHGKLFVGDIFECDENMCKYLTETNALGRSFVRIIEVPKKVEKEEMKTTTKKVSKKK